ncbi:MAG TPA: hypothetical protein VJZ49_15665 [Syntrophales bacterium]|nr:hypothetical protein [Syntrophales bacterium]
MGASVCSSSTGTVTGTDPDFVLTQKINNPQGVVLLVKYTRTAASDLTITIDKIFRPVHATDLYRMTSLTGTALGAWAMVISATGNYEIPIPIIEPVKTIVVNLTVGAAAQGNAIVCNVVES